MENSETQVRVINLGKKLVSELDLEPGVDTLSRWMAHHIASLITQVEEANPDQILEIKQQCFSAILQLWSHRSCYPTEEPPLANFEGILEVLDRLDDQGNSWFKLHRFKETEAVEANKELSEWTKAISLADTLTKALLKYCVQKATLFALDKETKDWLEKSKELLTDSQLEIIIRLTADAEKVGSLSESELLKNERVKLLTQKLKTTQQMIELATIIKQDINAELRKINE